MSTLSIIFHLVSAAFVLSVAAGVTGQDGSGNAHQIIMLADDIGRGVKPYIPIV